MKRIYGTSLILRITKHSFYNILKTCVHNKLRFRCYYHLSFTWIKKCACKYYAVHTLTLDNRVCPRGRVALCTRINTVIWLTGYFIPAPCPHEQLLHPSWSTFCCDFRNWTHGLKIVSSLFIICRISSRCLQF